MIVKRVMRAVDVDLARLRYPTLVSPKVDGVRAYVSRRGVVMSRQGKPIPSEQVQSLFGRKDLAGLDGELYVGRPYAPDVFAKSVSAVMSANKPAKGLWFGVFDIVPTNLSTAAYFDHRLKKLREWVAMLSCTVEGICTMAHVVVDNERQLLAFETKALDRGYEGIIIRDPLANYKEHYSTPIHQGYLRLKRFVEGEAEILRCNELLHNNNAKVDGKKTSHKAGKVAAGVLGSVDVRDLKTGKEFSLGAGFTDAQRKALWKLRAALPGTVVRHRTFPKGAVDKPRFPTFAGFRSRLDL